MVLTPELPNDKITTKGGNEMFFFFGYPLDIIPNKTGLTEA